MAELITAAQALQINNNQPARTWSLTVNNYTEAELQIIRSWTVLYRVIGKEVGESGTPHLQCWISFVSTKRFSAVQKLLPRGHWEVGKSKDGENYCMKDGDFEITDNRKQGKRSDLDKVYEMIKEGHDINKVMEVHPSAFIKYYGGIQRAIMQTQQKREAPPEVIVIWGLTGVGKSKYVSDHELDIYWVNHSGKWWDGYQNQSAICLDDYRGSWFQFHELLRLLDRYPTNVEIKGGYMTFNAKKIYITSDRDPREWYPNISFETYKQLERRITKIIHMISTSENPDVTTNKRFRWVDGVEEVETQQLPAPATVHFNVPDTQELTPPRPKSRRINLETPALTRSETRSYGVFQVTEDVPRSERLIRSANKDEFLTQEE